MGDDAPAFLAGGGEMGARMRAFDWAATPLGAPDTWPQSLRSTVSVCLNSPILGTVLWGPDLRMLYNDAYIPSMAERHPDALGCPVAEVWGDAWALVAAPFHRAMETGEGFSQETIELPMVRRGRPETTYWNFSAAPIRGEDGAIVGLFNQGFEITAKVLAARRAASERERQRLIFQQMPGFVGVLTGPDHVYEYVNDAYLTIAGRRDFVGRAVREVFPELAGQGFFELLDQVYASGEAFSAQSMPIHLAGEAESRFIDLLYRPIRDDDGAVTGIFVGGYDTTERVRAENELRRLNADLERQVIARARERGRTWAVSPDLLGVLNGDGYFERTNPAWQTTLGWTEVELRTTRFLDFVHPDDHARTATAFEEIKRGRPVLRFENRYRDKTGGYRWLSWVTVPEAEKFYCSARDITAEKAQAADLRERTRERDRLWETTNDLMGTAGLDGYLKALNPAWVRLLGWSERELLGQPFAAVINPDDHAETISVVKRLASGETVTGFVDRVLTKDGGERFIMWTAVPYQGTDVFHIVGRDITEQRQAEEALRQSQKMEAVGQLTGGLAHDFNNLLAGISGSLELMQARLSQGRVKDVERYLTAAQGAARRAAALTHRLLAFSRRQTLAPKPTDVNKLVTGLEELIRRTVGPAITIETVGASSLWTALVDPPQLENALLNLCINARDAMPDGGRITIETGNKWMDARAARQHDMPAGQYLSLCVTDTGTGMAPDVIDKVFEPFFTTKPIGEGTGLGLSMIYGFAQQSGGQVRIYSEVGKGTTVCIYLPRHYGESDAEDEGGGAGEAGRAEQGQTVLIVDDEPVVRMLVTDVLEELGYTAIEAIDGAAGLKVLQSNARIDLLVTDVGLPGGMNGRQMADAGRVTRPALKVLFITGYAENAVLGHGHLDPGMEVMTKPFGMDALAARIKELIAA